MYPTNTTDLLGDPIMNFGEVSAQAKKEVPFLTIENGVIQSSPLGMAQFLSKNELEHLIMSTMARSQYAPEIQTVVESGGNATVSVTLANVNANANNGGRTFTMALLPFFIVQISSPQLNAIPAGQISVTPTIPYELHGTVNFGTISISQAAVTNRLSLTIVPSIIVQSKPRATLAALRSGASLSVAVTGLATGSQVSVIVPGTTHPSLERTLAELRS